MGKLAIVICNYNKKDFVLECIESFLRSDDDNFDIFVVDNASTDGSADAIGGKYQGRLTLLLNEVNTGGAGGFNCGMQEVVSRGGYQYIVLADNDVTVKANTISELRRYMNAHNDVGVCGAVIFQTDNPEITQEMGANISVSELTNKPLYHQAKMHELPPVVECDYVPIGASVIRVEALKKAGFMDDGYFLYWDDMEFCWRIREEGYKIHAVSSAITYHRYSLAKYNQPFTVYYYFRNKINCFARHASDADFELLPEIITKRVYRSMVCNKDNAPVATAYMYALNDALDGVMGKAQDYKIPPPRLDKKWHGIVKGKSNILIEFDSAFIKINLLLTKLRELCDAKITIATNNANLDNFRLGNVRLIDKKNDHEEFDLIITVCYHVLDFSYASFIFTKGRSLLYDNYENTVSDEEDLIVYKYYEENYHVFKAMMQSYVRDKLGILRNSYKNSKPD
jgi:GT2 family glycosyltransferase